MKLNNSRKFILGLALTGTSFFSQALAVDYYVQTASGSMDRYVVSTGDGGFFRTLGARAYCGYLYVTTLADSRCVRPVARPTAAPNSVVVQATSTSQGEVYNFTLPDQPVTNTTNLAPTPTYVNTPVYVAPNTQSIVSQVLAQLGNLVGIPGPKGDKGDKGDAGAAGSGSTVYSGTPSYYSNASVGGSYNGATSPNPTYVTVNTGSLNSGNTNSGSVSTGNLTASGTTILATTTINGSLTLNPVATGTSGSPILVHDPVTGEVKQVDPSSLLASNTTNVLSYTGGASNTMQSTVNGVVSTTSIGTLNNVNLTGTTTSENIVNSGNFITNFLSAVTGYISNLFFDNATGTNITATGTANLANIVGTNATITNITGTNAAFTNLSASGTTNIAGNTNISGGTTTITGVLDLSNASVTLPNGPIAAATITNLVSENATITNLNVATGTFAAIFTDLIEAATGIFTDLFADNITATNTATQNLTANNATITDLAVTNLDVPHTVSVSGNVLTSDVGGSVGTTTVVTSNVAGFASTTNIITSTVNGVVGTTTIDGLTDIELMGTTTADNIITNTISAITGWFTNLFFDNATGTNITATGTANLANVIATNTLSTNIEGTNATLTNATSTNLFAINASLTNATISNLAVDSISVPNTLSSAGNVMTSNVGGSISTTTTVNSNDLTFATSTSILSSIINGITSTTSLAGLLCNNTLLGQFAFCNGGNSSGANATLGTNDNFAQIFETNNTERMRIDNSGLVGIGTNTPTADLHISKNVAGGVITQTENTDTSASGYAETVSQNGAIRNILGAYEAGGYAYVGTESNHDLRFSAGNQTWAALTVGGNFGLGIDSSTMSPTNKLHIKDVADPVRLEGLQTGNATNSIVIADSLGVLKTISSASLLASNTTNVISTTTNSFTSIVNGISSAVVNFINSFTQSASGNVLTTTINGVVATSSIITSNSLSVSTSTGILTSSVNGVSTTTDLSPLLATQNLQKVTDNGATTTNTINVQNLAGQYSRLGGANLTFGTSYNNNSTRLDFSAPASTSNTLYLPGTNSGTLALSVNGVTANGSGNVTLAPADILKYYAENNNAPSIASPVASGLYSVAIGDNAQSTGQFSLALGLNQSASGIGSVAIGATNSASGDGSITLGGSNDSGGYESITFGTGNNSTNSHSVGFGFNNRVLADNSFAVGSVNEINGSSSYLIGDSNNTVSGQSYVFGRNNTDAAIVGTDNMTFGQDNTNKGQTYTYLLGHDNVSAEGNNEFIIGYSNTSYSGGSKDNYIIGESNDLSGFSGSHFINLGSYFGGSGSLDRTASVGFNNQVITSSNDSSIFGNNSILDGTTNSYILGANITNNVSGSVDIGTTDSTKATIDGGGRLTLRGALNVTGSDGTAGQILQSAGASSMPVWVNASTLSTSIPVNNGLTNNAGTIQLGGPLVQNTVITHAGNRLTYDLSSINTQTGITMGANVLTTGTILDVNSSYNLINSTNGIFRVINSSATQNGVLARFQSNNVAGSGMTILANGNTGFGTTSPLNQVHIASSTGAVSGLRLGINSTSATTTYNNKQLTVNANGDVVVVDDAIAANVGWSTTGNTGLNAAVNFLGTNDNQNVVFKRNGVQAGLLDASSVSFGVGALNPVSTGTNNVAFGVNSLFSNTSGNVNVAIGAAALRSNTLGGLNTAVGHQALRGNIIGNQNTSNGYQALYSSTGDNNTAMGYKAGLNLLSGSNNIAIGSSTDFPSNTGSNQMNIANMIFGTGLTGTSTSPTGYIGIGITAPGNALHIASSTGAISGLRLGINSTTATTTANGKLLTVNASGDVVLVDAAATNSFATANNGLTATGTTVQLGGSLIQNTTISNTAVASGDLITMSNSAAGLTGSVLAITSSQTSAPNGLLKVAAGGLTGFNAAQLVSLNSSSGIGLAVSGGTNYTGSGLVRVSSTGITTGTGIEMLSTNNALNSTLGLLNISNTGTSTSGRLASFKANGNSATDGLYILTNGNIGIGTTSPLNQVHIASSTGAVSGLRLGINASSATTTYNNKQLTVDANGDVVLVDDAVAANKAWSTLGNLGTVPATNFLGTIDNQALVFRTNNLEKLRITTGGRLDFSNMLGSGNNIFVEGGNEGVTGNGNTGTGAGSLVSLTSGSQNTAYGLQSLSNNTIGSQNTAIGYLTQQTNVAGSGGVAVGAYSQRYLNSTTTAWANTNVSIGNEALRGDSVSPASNTFNRNVAIGEHAMVGITTGNDNVGLGYWAGKDITAGSGNVFLGASTGYGITTGTNNTILGANVSGLAAALSNNIIIADGAGNRRINVIANGNTGIGTITPGNQLEVASSTGAVSGLRLAINSATAAATGTGKFLAVDANGDVYQSNLMNLPSLAVGTSTLAAGKVATFAGDIDVTGTIDPTRILFTNLAGVDSPSYNPSTNSNNYKIEFAEGGNLQFASASSSNIMRMLNNGNVGIGYTDPLNKLTVYDASSAYVQVIGANNGGYLSEIYNSAPNNSLQFKTGRGTPTAKASLGLNDTIGRMLFIGHDGTSELQSAEIKTIIDAAPGTGNMPSAMVFSTRQAGFGAISERVRISNNGNVSIGSSANTDRLFVSGDQVRFDLTGAGSQSFLFNNDGGKARIFSTAGIDYQSNVTTGIQHTFANDIGAAFAGTDFMTIDSRSASQTVGMNILKVQSAEKQDALVIKNTGNIGVGTSTPGYRLDIYDISSAFAQTRVSGGGAGGGILTRLQNDGGKEYVIGVGGSNNNSIGTDAFFIRDGNSFVNRLVIASSTGNVGIGNFASAMPTAQLHTTGTVRFQAFGAGTLTTDASGNVTASSDERLKDIEGDFTRGLEDLKKIKPITYKWNDISGLEKENSYSGFSAQNVQSAIPEAVSTDPRGYLSLQERPILATVVNAIKELADKIEKFADEFTSKKINTEQLCIGATCLSEDDIKNIKSGTYQAPATAPLTSDAGDATTDSTISGTLSCQAGTQYDSTSNSCVAIPSTDATVEETVTPTTETPATEPVVEADVTTESAPVTTDVTPTETPVVTQ